MKNFYIMFAIAMMSHGFLLAQANKTGAGKCLSYNGTNAYVSISNESNFDFERTQPFTLEAWFQTNDTGAVQTIMGKGFNNSVSNGYLVLLRQDGSISVYLDNTWTSNSTTATTPSGYNDGHWHHLAVSYNGSSKSAGISIYVDGVNVGIKGIDQLTGSILNNEPLRIGYRGGSAPVPFKGNIDEVCVWNVARTQKEVRDHMCQKLTGSETGLVGYWRFDEDNGNTTYDSSPNGNNGTLTNMNNVADRVLSGAAIGDTSTYLYPSAWTADTVFSLAHADGDQLTVSNASNSLKGAHIYLVNTAPGDTTGLTGLANNDHYYGVFATNDSSTYTVSYNYNGNPHIINEDSLLLFERSDNAAAAWTNTGATLSTLNNTLNTTSANKNNGEYILNISGTPPVCSVNIGPDTTFCQGGSITLDAGAGHMSYSWSNSSTDQTITVNASGTYSVTVTDANSCVSHDTIIVTVNTCVGINNSRHPINASIQVFPNPATGTITLDIPSSFDTRHASLSIYDMLGNSIYQSGKYISSVDVSAFPTGIYFVQVKNESSLLYQKIVKQ